MRNAFHQKQIIIVLMICVFSNLTTLGQYPADVKSEKSDSLFYINPYLDWGTYFSGSIWLQSTTGGSCVSDNKNNFYFAGYTESHDNIATPGSFKEQITGEEDGYIQMFNVDGERIWGTYFGGANIDQIYDMILDLEGNIIIAGYTSSPDSIATPGTHQPELTGGSAAFIAKFSPNGDRIWGTYLSGNAGGWIMRMCVDHENNILACGNTRANSGFTTPGCHQPEFGGSPYGDGFLAKFNPDGTIQFCTYYGGEEIDEAWGVTVDNDDHIFISGFSSSTHNIATPGTQQPTKSLYNDCFVAKFTSSGVRLWGTYLGGISGDYPQDVRADANGNCVIVGSTTSLDNFTTPGAHKETIQGEDGFLVKYDANGMRIWGTYFGGWDDDGIADCVKTCDNSLLIIAGSTNSNNGISTSGAYQPLWYESHSPQGNGIVDGFLAAFDFDGNQVWGTYLGGNLGDQIGSISCDSLKNLAYIGSTTSVSAEYLTTPNCFQPQPASMHSAFFGRMISDTLTTFVQETDGLTFKVFPNPCTDQIVVSADIDFTGVVAINQMNDVVINDTFFPIKSFTLDISELQPGVYLLIISFGDFIKTEKIVKI